MANRVDSETRKAVEPLEKKALSANGTEAEPLEPSL